MPKDPAFLFYPGDYLRDTQCLSEKAQVAYDRIMCEHIRSAVISEQQLKFFTKRLTEDEKEELAMTLTKCEGGYKITWVAESIEKRQAFTESRRQSRLKSDEDQVRIYIVRDNVRLTWKVGSSVNPLRKYNELNNKKTPSINEGETSNKDLTLLWYSEPVARTEEKRLHKELKDKKLYGDWFILNPEDLSKIFTNYKGTYVQSYVDQKSERTIHRTENENENINTVLVYSEKKEGEGGKGGQDPPEPENRFVWDEHTELPDNVLEAAERNQFTRTQNKNTRFIQEMWAVFLEERKLEPEIKKQQYRQLSDLTTYFLNFMRTKHPKQNGTHTNLLNPNQPEKLGTSAARIKKAKEW